MNTIPIEALRIMDERFGHDNLIAVATCADGIPYVRAVNAYYEGSAFYVITYAKSAKMGQIAENPTVAICGEWFTAHAVAESLGWIGKPANADMADKLNTVFAEWIDNGHIDQADTNTIILRLRLTDGVLMANGVRYELQFS